jgi:response regulator of citrate/malate metabolism
MDNSLKTTVIVIENDTDFRELLNDVFERSELFDLVGSFDSVEEFGAEILKYKPFDSWLPQLLVVDVMSSKDPRQESASFISALRAEGFNFATLFVSSMQCGSLLRVLRKSHPHGWSSLQKTSRLTEQDIVEAAVSALNELMTT